MADTNNTVLRKIVSYDNMSSELLDAFKEKYPRGYADYLVDIKRIDKPNGEYFYAVPVEVPGINYLVKIKVKEDHIEDIDDGIFKSEEDGEDQDTVPAGDGDFPVSDDDIDAAGGGEQMDGDESGDE